MSGVLAHLRLDGSPADQDLVERMAAACPERGPDGGGIWAGGPVVLAHQRLCATPESGEERQPVTLPGRDLALTCDGTLYNREELAAALAGAAGLTDGGRALRSEPDSLLLLRAYETWGTDCLDRVIGDFAFLVWDGARRELVAAVDPLGMRPLFYHRAREHLLLASDARGLLAAPWVSRELDPVYLRSYVADSLPSDGRTAFREIRWLVGGQLLRSSRGGVEVRTYWEPRKRPERFRRDEDYVGRFRELLGQAVAARLRAAGPVASLLSGGLDSTSVTCLAAQVQPGDAGGPGARKPDLHCVTAVFSDAACDEREYARAVSSRYGLPHHFVPVENRGLLEAAIRCAESQAFPLIGHDPVLVECLLAECRRAGCRVVLTGIGGDEVLMSETILHRLFRKGDWGRWWTETRSWCRLKERPFWPMAAVIARRSLPEGLKRLRGGWRLAVWRLLTPAAAGGGRPAPWRAWRRQDYELASPVPWVRAPASSHGWQLMAELHRNQVFTRYGVEVRHPYLDRRLVEFLYSLPERWLIRDGRNKAILRESLEGILPDQVRTRMTTAAYGSFFDHGLRDLQGDRLRVAFSGTLAAAPFVREEVARRWVADYLEGREVLWAQFWGLVSLELWLRHFPALGAPGGLDWSLTAGAG